MPTKFSDIDEDRFLALSEAEREAVTDAWLARREHHHQPRFGPDREVALSLDSPASGGEDEGETWSLIDTVPDIVAPRYDLPPGFLDELERTLRLNFIHGRIFNAFFRRHIPPDQLSRRLGISRYAARCALDRVFKAIDSDEARACLARFGVPRFDHAPHLPQSRGLSYPERDRWGLLPVPDLWPEVMVKEKLDLISIQPHAPNYRKFYPGKVGTYIFMKSLDQLHIDLKNERDKHSRLTANLERARIAKREAETEVERIEASSMKEREEAVFAERDLPADLTKKLAEARAKVTAAEAALEAARSALQRQSGVVEDIARQIELRHQEALIAAIEGPRRDLMEALDNLVAKAHAFDEAVAKAGGGRFDIVMPPSRPDREVDYRDRVDTLNFIASALRLDWARARWGAPDNVPYFAGCCNSVGRGFEVMPRFPSTRSSRFTAAPTTSRFLRWGIERQPSPQPQALTVESFEAIASRAEVKYLQRRTFAGLAKAEGNRIVGTVPYNRISDNPIGPRILFASACFNASLSSADVRCCWESPSALLGRQSSGTLRLWDDRDRAALRFECDCPDTSDANNLMALLKRKDIDGLSVYYLTLRSHPAEDNLGPYRVIDEAHLIALAIAAFPAFSGAIDDVNGAIAAARAQGHGEGYAEASQNVKRQSKRASQASAARIELSRLGLLRPNNNALPSNTYCGKSVPREACQAHADVTVAELWNRGTITDLDRLSAELARLRSK